MRIVWTKEEKRALRDCMIDICYVTPMMTNKGLFKAAQEEVIPYERRTKVTDQKVFTYKTLINEARALAEKHRQGVSKPKPVPTPVPEAAPEPVRKLDTLGEVFELFIDALADRIMDKMIAAKQQVEKPEVKVESAQPILERGWLDAHLEKLTIRKQPVKRTPTVLVVGLNGCQMEVIKNYKPDLDFTFVTAEQALSHYTLNKDHTILMTKFINHSVQGKYRKHPNLHYCNGGVSELKHMLQIIFHKEYA
jgi:hypothetical protein